jgi:hypothetical protein
MRNWWEASPVVGDRLKAKPTQDLAAEIGLEIPTETGNWWEKSAVVPSAPAAAAPVQNTAPTLPYAPGAAGTAPSLEPTPEQFKAVKRSPAEEIARNDLLTAEAAAKGLISLFTGIPDLIAAVPTVGRNLLDQELPDAITGGADKPWDADLFPFTNAAFEGAGKLRDAVGIPDVKPETLLEKSKYNALEFGVGGLDPMNLARGAMKFFGPAGQTVDNAILKAADNFPEQLHNVNVQEAANARAAARPDTMAGNISGLVEQAKPSAAQFARGAGAGTAFTLSDEALPESTPEPIRAVVNPIAALMGAFIGPTAGRALVEPLRVANDIKRGVVRDKTAGKVGEGLFPMYPSQDTMERSSRIFQQETSDLPAAISKLDENLALAANDKVKNTTAQLSEDVGQLRGERAARLNPSTGAEFIERDKALAQQNADEFTALAPAERGNKQAVTQEVTGQVDAVRKEGEQQVSAAQERLAKQQAVADEMLVNAQIAGQKNIGRKEAAVVDATTKAAEQRATNKTTAQELAATPRLDRETAGKALVTDVLEPAKAEQRAIYKEKIAPYEADSTTQVDTSPGVPELETVMEELNAKVNMGSFEGQIRESMRQLVRLDDEGGLAEHALSPKELLALEQRVAAGARDAAAQKNGAAAKAFSGIRAAIDDILEEGGLQGDFLEARRFYRENIAEPFVHDTSGKVLRPGAKGEAYRDPLSESIPAYFQKGAKSGASMDQLLSAGGKEKVVPLVRDYTVDDMFKQFYDKQTGAFNTKGMRKYIDDRPEAFDRVPEIRTELHQMLNKLDSGESLAAMADMGVKDAKQALRKAGTDETRYLATRKKALSETTRLMQRKVAAVERAAAETLRNEERSAARFFLKNEDPVVAVSQAFGDQGNLVKNFRELKSRVDKDTSGKAAMGLKEAIYDHFENKVIKQNRATPVSGAQLEKIEKQYTDALVESGIWTADDKKVVETIRRRIDASSLSQNTRALPAEASTAENMGLSSRNMAGIRSLFRVFSSSAMQGGTNYSIFRDALKLYGSGKQARQAEEIVQRARMDPDLGRYMLKKNLTRYEESLYRARLGALFTTRRDVLVGVESQDENREK